jgi:hypothetical protein
MWYVTQTLGCAEMAAKKPDPLGVAPWVCHICETYRTVKANKLVLCLYLIKDLAKKTCVGVQL